MSRRVYTPKQMSAFVGRFTASGAMLGMALSPNDRAKKTEILQAALLNLHRFPHRVEACYAFADVLVERLEKDYGTLDKPRESTK
jgi:hypothetical protein